MNQADVITGSKPASSWSAWKMPCQGSFLLPADTLQDWAPWAKILCPRKRQKVPPMFHFVVRLCFHAVTTLSLRSVDVGIYVQFYLCPILCYLQKKNTIKNQGSLWCSPQVVDIWLLVWIMYGKPLTVWVVPGVSLFCVFVFYFWFWVIASSTSC